VSVGVLKSCDPIDGGGEHDPVPVVRGDHAEAERQVVFCRCRYGPISTIVRASVKNAPDASEATCWRTVVWWSQSKSSIVLLVGTRRADALSAETSR
jgi:hypothetical protein